MNSQRSLAPTPPIKGSFPLDHKGECKEEMQDFLECIRAFGKHSKCREETKQYLACRMNRNLMQREKMEDIGFGDGAVVVPPTEPRKVEGGEFIPGLSAEEEARRRKKGTRVFG